MVATSDRLVFFSKGAEFDGLAHRLHDLESALAEAASRKELDATKRTLSDIKATCRSCHQKFR